MSIKRITISVPAVVAARIKSAAGAKPVSTWVTEVIEERLEDAELERLWQEFYRSVAPTPEQARRAEAMLGRLTRRKRKSAA
jgi:hypothetical protein